MTLEAKAIQFLLSDTDHYFTAIELGIEESAFTSSQMRQYYIEIRNYFDTEGKPPDYLEFQIYLLKNKIDVVEFLKLFPVDETCYDADVIKLLIENMKERQARQIIAKEQTTGLDFLYNITEQLNRLVLSHQEKDNTSIIDVAEKLISDIGQVRRSEFNPNFIKTGFKHLDKNIIGLAKGSITVIAGRPGQGKTTFSVQMLTNLMKNKVKCGFISIEMPLERLLIKLFAKASNLDSRRIQNGDLTDSQYEQLKISAREVISQNYLIDDTPSQTIERLKAKISKWIHQKNVEVIFIDYFTLIRTNYKTRDIRLELNLLSDDLRRFARTNHIAIVILSQLNRQSESRADKRPQLSDLKETSNIEQDSDSVFLLHHPQSYDLQVPEASRLWKLKDGEPCKPEEYFELIVAKARNGIVGTIPLRYEKAFHRISDLIYVP